jgi:hypothetical protein
MIVFGRTQMKRTFVAIGIAVLMFAVGAAVSVAEEQTHPAPAVQQSAPAAKADNAVETSGGCMPDGSCCGHGACAKAAAASGKGALADSAGGCPCMKNKKAQ